MSLKDNRIEQHYTLLPSNQQLTGDVEVVLYGIEKSDGFTYLSFYVTQSRRIMHGITDGSFEENKLLNYQKKIIK